MGRPKNPNKKFKSSINGHELLLDQNRHIVAGDKIPESELQGSLLVSDEKVAGTPDQDSLLFDVATPAPKVANLEPGLKVHAPLPQEFQDLFERVNDHQVMMEEAGLTEVPLPKLDLEYIRNMFEPPKCKVQHAYGLMKICQILEDLAVQLFFACPHNVHLQQALLELELVHETCNKAVQSE